MGHREDLLAGAVRCLREKGYARTTARDIVAASGTNLASIGYHYGSTHALLDAAVFQAMDDFGAEIAQVMRADVGLEGSTLERFERFWAHVIDSFRANPGVWAGTFDVFGVAQHDPQVRAAVAQGIDDGRALWAHALYGLDADGDDQGVARAVGSLHQALLSGMLVQRLIDPDRAPSAADLAAALLAIASQVGADAVTTKSPPGTGSITDQKLLAAQLFNQTWRLLEHEGRASADDDRMIHTAHASRYHWGQVPDATPAHLARGEWLISRVYAVLGRAEPALHHARRVLDLCQEHSIGDFDLAFAYEALARAYAIAGDTGLARDYTDQALAAAGDIADSEDRDLVLADLETIPGQPRYW